MSDDPSLIEALAAGIAHEVRNPLNALQINVQILEQELRQVIAEPNAHAYTLLSKIASELRSLDSFVSEFLRFARPPKLNVEPVHVRPLLSDLATFIGPECSRRSVELALALEKGPMTVFADGFQLKHAVLNLVLNALQAIEGRGRISIETSGDSQELVICVADTGEGIPPEIQDRILDVFFTTREGGTGLGLPIVKRIAEAHGGALHVTSTPGEGTQARIVLPVRPKG